MVEPILNDFLWALQQCVDGQFIVASGSKKIDTVAAHMSWREVRRRLLPRGFG